MSFRVKTGGNFAIRSPTAAFAACGRGPASGFPGGDDVDSGASDDAKWVTGFGIV
jgi:hypothetical protein